ncbi:hypothetical protein L873DRAFT_1793609 [Choiromyces venosus 120613-1]|uniref:Uncharacterized protein n=1 Tax=Choiromyces venosus 120613-1 TaxID=1336337 RepID=A0A3N4J8Y0_9PEZI|nr:hypothetical protein L873DRAFT_1793609 [Choiromyces venosus 120613-1]
MGRRNSSSSCPEEKNKAAAIKKAQKNIQVAINKVKVLLKCCGIDAHKAEKGRVQQIRNIGKEGQIVPPELLIAIADPEKNPTEEDLESLQPPPDLLQALLLLEETSVPRSVVIDPQLLNYQDKEREWDIDRVQQYTEGGDGQQRGNNESTWILESDSEDLAGESDSDSSCISYDSIARNADFRV